MYSENACLGIDCALEDLKAKNEKLNAMTLAEVNGSQELVMMNSFARESSEYLYNKCLQERISEVASWRWVLTDLSKRLEDSIAALKHESNALKTVVQRVQNEIHSHCRESTRPGAMSPLCDQVEDAIQEELRFLREQKKNFESMIPELEKQTAMLEKTKKKIVADILSKERAITVDETNALENNNADFKDWKKKRKKGLPIIRWEKRCAALKRAGLRALANGIITRQQVRGARTQLSVAAQSYTAKVDSALRRRLHANKIKLQDLCWQRDEALLDYNSLGEELSAIEQSLIQTMEQERVVETRLANRTLRPGKELTKDDVDRNLTHELVQIKQFSKEMNNNLKRISKLQAQLTSAISGIDCCAEDLIQVIQLDEDRIRSRAGDDNSGGSPPQRQPSPTPSGTRSPDVLDVIPEDAEEDDYPFDS